jgi:hypothetical protein
LGHKAVDRVSRQGSFDREPQQAGLVAHDVLGSGPATTSWLRQSASGLRASSGPKPERQHAGLAGISTKSREARLVKFADIISNLRAIAVSPASWSNDRRLGYLNSSRNLADAEFEQIRNFTRPRPACRYVAAVPQVRLGSWLCENDFGPRKSPWDACWIAQEHCIEQIFPDPLGRCSGTDGVLSQRWSSDMRSVSDIQQPIPMP